MAEHRDAVTKEVKDLKLIHDLYDPEHQVAVLVKASISDEIVDGLKKRLEDDYQRSRQIYREYKEREAKRLADEQIRLDERIARYRGQSAGMFLETIDKDPDLKDMRELLTALHWAAVKRNPPIIESSVYMIDRPGGQATGDSVATGGQIVDAPGGGGADNRVYTFRVVIDVTADPWLYKEPYRFVRTRLDKAGVRKAISEKEVAGTPLLPDTIKALQYVLENELSKFKEDEVIVPFFTAYASSMPDLTKAIPLTLERLPGIVREGEDERFRYMMGQTFAFGPAPAKPAPGPSDLDAWLVSTTLFGEEDNRNISLQVVPPTPNLLKRPTGDRKPKSLDAVWGFNIYRRFDKPHAEERLRYRPDNVSLDRDKTKKMPPVFRLSERENCHFIGAIRPQYWWWKYSDKVAGRDGLGEYMPPYLLDPADPRGTRWYAYSAVTFARPGKRFGGNGHRFTQDPNDLVESGLSEWIKCEVEPVICWLGRESATSIRYTKSNPAEADIPVLTVEDSDDLEFAVYPVLKINGKRILPPAKSLVTGDEEADKSPVKHIAWARAFPGRYVYVLDFDNGNKRYVGTNPSHTEAQILPNHRPHFKRGIHPLTVSTVIDGKTVSAKFKIMIATKESNINRWNRELELARLTLKNSLEFNDLSKKRTHITRAMKLASMAKAHTRVAECYRYQGEFKKAEAQIQNALRLAEQALASDSSIQDLTYVYDRAADIYFSMGDLNRWAAMRAAEARETKKGQTTEQIIKSGRLRRLYMGAGEELFALTGDFEKARKLYMKADPYRKKDWKPLQWPPNSEWREVELKTPPDVPAGTWVAPMQPFNRESSGYASEPSPTENPARR